VKTLVNNSKATFDYEIVEKIEAGVSLLGHEVKSIKTGKVSIKGSYVKILQEEAWLIGANISPYQPNNTPDDYDKQRSRRLLLKKSELKRITGKSNEAGLTLVPLRLYLKNNKIKLEVGIARGKKKYDKRDKIKKRESDRDISRKIKESI